MTPQEITSIYQDICDLDYRLQQLLMSGNDLQRKIEALYKTWLATARLAPSEEVRSAVEECQSVLDSMFIETEFPPDFVKGCPENYMENQ